MSHGEELYKVVTITMMYLLTLVQQTIKMETQYLLEQLKILQSGLHKQMLQQLLIQLRKSVFKELHLLNFMITLILRLLALMVNLLVVVSVLN